MERIVRVICAADGVTKTPHDGRFVVNWNPHVKAGTLALNSTTDPMQARRFKNGLELIEWRTISRIEPSRPWDGQPNRPLTAISIESIKIEESHEQK